MDKWNLAHCKEVDTADKWDGHEANDVVNIILTAND
jgi:hypothetical protein